MNPEAFVWRCESGHEPAVSELEWTQGTLEPKCPVLVTRDNKDEVCMARLVRRLRPFPSVHETGDDA